MDCKISRLSTWVLTGILLAYFIFTSGIIYEAIGSNVIDKLVIPYSIALSGERTGLVRIYTDDDIKCAEWVAREKALPIAGDYDASELLMGYILPEDIYRLDSNVIQEDTRSTIRGPLDHCYIFISTWNTQHRATVIGIGTGLREIVAFPITSGWQEVFRSGQSVVYKK
jgi:hypothetical protein